MSDPSLPSRSYLSALGAYGFERQEPIVLAALVSGDPILLIGRSGTGKTFLLNTISEALALEHRHYNASLISFDDLVGFPYPDDGIGYVAPNAIEADRYEVSDTVCQRREDPRTWTDHVNDQCISVGWAGYDAKVAWLPPEHYLAHTLGAALAHSCRGGRLAGQGPDGKLLVRVRESTDQWQVEQILVTLQQLPQVSLLELTARLVDDLRDAYGRIQERDPRWAARFDEVELLVNPNGPLLNGGSDGDNGQTGRKLVVDYYGPRVAIGGGALSGKDLSHIDRVGAYAARQAALQAVRGGAHECRVVVAYAPNRDLPLDVVYEMERRAEQLPPSWFAHRAVRERYCGGAFVAALGAGAHFIDPALPWNQ